MNEKGHAIQGAIPVLTPLIGRPKSNSNGFLKHCKQWFVGVAAPGYVAFVNEKNDEFYSLQNGQTVVMKAMQGSGTITED